MTRGISRVVVAAADTTDATLRPRVKAVTAGRSPELEHLVARVVDIALDQLGEGVLVPTVTVVSGDTARVKLFGDPMQLGADLTSGLDDARRFVDSLDPSKIDRYVWVFDGYAGFGSDHSDAMVMEAAEAGEPHGWQLAVRYKLHRGGASAIDTSVEVVDGLLTSFTSRI